MDSGILFKNLTDRIAGDKDFRFPLFDPAQNKDYKISLDILAEYIVNNYITAGTNISISGAGTYLSPLSISATGGGGGGSGVVNTGTQYQLGYYAANGTTISGLTLITASRALASDTNGLPIASSTTATELGHVNGVTSPIQTQLNSKLGNTLTNSNIFVGNGSNVATGVTLSLNGTAGAFSLSNTGSLTFPDAATGTRGLLNSTDWNTFNSKQGTITLTTTGTSGAATLIGNTLNIPQYSGGGGGGTVTTVSIVSTNGFAGSVATATTTPAITLSTTITGILKGNGTAISAASNTTDYVPPVDFSTVNIVTGTPNTLTLNTATAQFPEFRTTVSVTSFTLTLQNVKSGSSGTLKITRGTASAIVMTFDSAFTNLEINTNASLNTPYTFAADTIGKIITLQYVCDGTTLLWSIIDGSGGIPAGTSSQILIYNASNILTPVSSSGDVTNSNTGVWTIGANKVTLPQMAQLANNKVIGNLSGITANPVALDTNDLIVSDTTQQTALNTESGWSNNTKTISGILSGQMWEGTNLTDGLTYRYFCQTAGTATRVLTAQAVDIINLTTIGQPLYEFYADAGNGTTVETDLYSYTIPATGTKGNLAINGQKILATAGGIFVGSATATRQIKVKLAGTTLLDTTAMNITANTQWDIEVFLIRVSSSVIRYVIKFNSGGLTVPFAPAVGELTGLTLTSTNILKITGQAGSTGAATNDIVAKLIEIRYVPQA